MPGPKETPAKRVAILEAALELIAAGGFHGSPTAKIAEKAGVGIGSIYRYFSSKEDLIQALFTYLAEKSRQAIMQDLDTRAPIKEQFIHLMKNTFQYLIENREAAAFLEQYFNSPFGFTHKRDAILNEGEGHTDDHPMHALLDKARKDKIAKDLPRHILGALTFGPIILLVRDIHAGLITVDARMRDKIIAACWDAVKR
ncbi:MAG: TetR/AcrR family transcriptional regulator [Syntrophaceae bacterium]